MSSALGSICFSGIDVTLTYQPPLQQGSTIESPSLIARFLLLLWVDNYWFTKQQDMINLTCTHT